jgi:hypothetical protein
MRDQTDTAGRRCWMPRWTRLGRYVAHSLFAIARPRRADDAAREPLDFRRVHRPLRESPLRAHGTGCAAVARSHIDAWCRSAGRWTRLHRRGDHRQGVGSSDGSRERRGHRHDGAHRQRPRRSLSRGTPGGHLLGPRTALGERADADSTASASPPARPPRRTSRSAASRCSCNRSRSPPARCAQQRGRAARDAEGSTARIRRHQRAKRSSAHPVRMRAMRSCA